MTEQIPKKIYYTFHKDPTRVAKAIIEHNKALTPEYEHIFYNDTDCLRFIRSNFDPFIYKCYNTLVPGAYKADLWRLCILYEYGGVYIDIGLRLRVPIKTYLTESYELMLVIEKSNIKGYYNAFMASRKGHPFILHCIYYICNNIQGGYYGRTPIDPTGPAALYKASLCYTQHLGCCLFMRFTRDLGIYHGSTRVVECDKGPVRSEYRTDILRYDALWWERKIYKR